MRDAAAEQFALGLSHQQAGRVPQAIACYRKAIELRPDYAEAHGNLGVALRSLGRLDEARACYERALAWDPGSSATHGNLGVVLNAQGEVEEAIAHCRQAIALDAANAAAHSTLGSAMAAQGRIEEARACFEKAAELQPELAELQLNLGRALRMLGRLDEALARLRRAAELAPRSVDAHNELAVVFQARGELEAALAAAREAIGLDPAVARSHYELAVALGELGMIDEAMAALDKAVALDSGYHAAHSSMLFYSHYSRLDAGAIFARHRRWAERHEPAPPPPRTARRGGRLRVGYVSPDFRRHSIAFFLLPILAHHDRDAFEVTCYSDVRRPDDVTRQMQSHAEVWRPVAGLPDEALADLVRRDEIDILVDLTVHSGSNRLLAFARKPAPVQATYLGYAGTTGLAAMDYKITDHAVDPVGRSESHHSEKLARLPDCYFCYRPPVEAAQLPVPRPARGRRVTFCSFQNIAKLSATACALWARILKALPDARLILKARGLGGTATRQRLLSMFAAQGVGAAQLQIEDWDDMARYLARFAEVDIALDTTPFNGGTSSCHALWMGIPVVTLAGETSVGRVGSSILGALGLPELVAASADAYVEIACRLAREPERLAELRATLRARMQASPLMDGPRFTASLEKLYREMCRG